MQHLIPTPTWIATSDVPSAPTVSMLTMPSMPSMQDERTDPACMLVSALVLSAVSWALVVWLAVAALSI